MKREKSKKRQEKRKKIASESCSLIWLHYLSETIYFLEAHEKCVVYIFSLLVLIVSRSAAAFLANELEFTLLTRNVSPENSRYSNQCHLSYIFFFLLRFSNVVRCNTNKETCMVFFLSLHFICFYLCKYAWSIVSLCKRRVSGAVQV